MMATSTFSNEDDGSRSSSDTSYDMNMTEDEAMAIWLQRNEEIGERVREREAAEAAQQRASSSPHHSSREGSSSPGGSSDDCSDESLHSHRSDSVESGDTNSGFQHAAAVTHSDAWNRAISHNVMGEYDPYNTDPAYQNAYHAYQRFVDMNQPGVADNFVASTPGLAALMEQRRHLMARQRHLDFQLQQMDHHMHTSPMISSCHDTNYDALLSSQSSAAPPSQDHQGGHHSRTNNTPLSPSRWHDEIVKSEDGLFSITRVAPHPTFRSSSSTAAAENNNPTHHVSAATSAQILEYKRLQQAHSSQLLKSGDNSSKGTTSTNTQPSYFYAFAYRTQYTSRAVTCSCCQSRMYTAPLAEYMFCQSCAQISKVEGGAVGEDNVESRWEGKMQEAEDMMDMGY
eukprot:scaffold2553_cov162-Skeletonema_marinoi.AAC.5